MRGQLVLRDFFIALSGQLRLHHAIAAGLFGLIQGHVHLLQEPRGGLLAVNFHSRFATGETHADRDIQVYTIRYHERAVRDVGAQATALRLAIHQQASRSRTIGSGERIKIVTHEYDFSGRLVTIRLQLLNLNFSKNDPS